MNYTKSHHYGVGYKTATLQETGNRTLHGAMLKFIKWHILLYIQPSSQSSNA